LKHRLLQTLSWEYKHPLLFPPPFLSFFLLLILLGSCSTTLPVLSISYGWSCEDLEEFSDLAPDHDVELQFLQVIETSPEELQNPCRAVHQATNMKAPSFLRHSQSLICLALSDAPTVSSFPGGHHEQPLPRNIINHLTLPFVALKHRKQ
jgi:hypothetical protein